MTRGQNLILSLPDQPPPCVLANSLQHREAQLAGHFSLPQQILVQKHLDGLRRVNAQVAIRIAYGYRALDRAAAHEHRQPAEERALPIFEQVVTPIYGATKGALAG